MSGQAIHRGDVAFTGAVDLSEADVTMPTSALTDEDNVDWTGDHSFAGDVVLTDATTTFAAGSVPTAAVADAAVTPVKESSGRRELAADAACVLAATDRVIELNKTTGTTAVTMTATHAGHRVRVFLGVRSGGDATLAVTRGATAGTVTLDAVGEGCDISYNGSVWKLDQLLGGATIA